MREPRSKPAPNLPRYVVQLVRCMREFSIKLNVCWSARITPCVRRCHCSDWGRRPQVSEQTLAFPSVAAAESAPQTQLGKKRRVTGVLVLNGELPANAEATVTQQR